MKQSSNMPDRGRRRKRDQKQKQNDAPITSSMNDLEEQVATEKNLKSWFEPEHTEEVVVEEMNESEEVESDTGVWVLVLCLLCFPLLMMVILFPLGAAYQKTDEDYNEWRLTQIKRNEGGPCHFVNIADQRECVCGSDCDGAYYQYRGYAEHTCGSNPLLWWSEECVPFDEQRDFAEEFTCYVHDDCTSGNLHMEPATIASERILGDVFRTIATTLAIYCTVLCCCLCTVAVVRFRAPWICQIANSSTNNM